MNLKNFIIEILGNNKKYLFYYIFFNFIILFINFSVILIVFINFLKKFNVFVKFFIKKRNSFLN